MKTIIEQINPTLRGWFDYYKQVYRGQQREEIFPKVVDELSRLCQYGRQIITKIKDEHEHKRLKNSIP